MPSLLVYLAVTASLIGAAALVIEHACVSVGQPRRFVWLAALLASFALPAYSVLAPRGSAGSAPAVVAPLEPAPAVTVTPSEPRPSTSERPATSALPLLDFSRRPFLDAWGEESESRGAALDGLLIVLWAASSTGVLCFYGVSFVMLYRASRRWPIVRLEDADVLVSERLGPAIFGFFRPRIVVPRWLLGTVRDERALVLRHEREHAAARDPLLLTAALLLVALAPWNPALWWQLSRLRASMELDCDARVVRGGANPIVYSEALLAVRERRVAAPLPAVALTEPVSRLEGRIRTLLRTPSALRRAAALVSTPLAVIALTFAYALTPPALFAQEARTTPRDPLTGMTLGGERVVILVDTSASMLGNTLVDVLRRRNMLPEAQRASPKWRQTVNSVEWLATQIAPGTQVQVIGFAEQASSLIAGSGGQWVTVTDGSELETAVRALSNMAPSGPSNLYAGITALRGLEPPPDNVYLLVDGLPTMGETSPDRDGVTSRERADHFYRALREVPSGVPFNVILFAMEGDPYAAPLFWELGLRTGGALLGAPAADGAGDSSAADIFAVDSDGEYVIFIVDTSGSMLAYAWSRVQEHIRATLAAYPNLRGVQILNDEGSYLFSSYRGAWMPDTPATREAIVDGMRNWDDFSDSSPREGILAAIDTFYDPNKNIAVYVYGDDFSRGSIAGVTAEVERRNQAADAQGDRRVRIHSVAFPTFWQINGELHTAANLAVLMRELSAKSGGRFVGLPLTPVE